MKLKSFSNCKAATAKRIRVNYARRIGQTEYADVLERLPKELFTESLKLNETHLDYLDDEGKALFYKWRDSKKKKYADRCRSMLKTRKLRNDSNLSKEEHLYKTRKRRIKTYYKKIGNNDFLDVIDSLPLTCFSGKFKLKQEYRLLLPEPMKTKFDKCCEYRRNKLYEKLNKAWARSKELMKEKGSDVAGEHKKTEKKNARIGFVMKGNVTSVIIKKTSEIAKTPFVDDEKVPLNKTVSERKKNVLKKKQEKKVEKNERIECPVCGRKLTYDDFTSPYRFCCKRCERNNKSLRVDFNKYEDMAIDTSDASKSCDIERYVHLRNALSVEYYKLEKKCVSF
ncbi:MAG: hypothetical protein J6Y55_10965 [Bacteroidales bacterium]|nr:hypothetical protein [Bacteroidales bacterium]